MDIKKKEELKQFLKDRPELNRRALGRLIDWHHSCFNGWMKASGVLTDEKAELLSKELERFGYKG